MQVVIEADRFIQNKASLCITGMSNAQAATLLRLIQRGYESGCGHSFNPDEEFVYDEIMMARSGLPEPEQGLISD